MARLGSQRPPKGANDARRHGALKTVGISDSNNELPHSNGLGISKSGRHKIRRGNTHHRKICIRIISNLVCLIALSVRQRDFNAVRSMNNVAVREDEPIRSEDEA